MSIVNTTFGGTLHVKESAKKITTLMKNQNIIRLNLVNNSTVYVSTKHIVLIKE